MHTTISALSALCVAITAAMTAPAAGAQAAPDAQARHVTRLVQSQRETTDKTVPAKEPDDTSDQAAPTNAQDNTSGQSVPARATSSPQKATATTLGTVTVTATRRTETLQTVPMPISVLTYHDIQRQHLKDFADYAATVPGLNVVSARPGFTELSIRGISSGSAQPSASVGVYIDNTPYGSSSVFAEGSALTPNIDPADLKRIEVLRGPQGTLYGAGALGGVIRFITIPPNTQNYAGRLQVGGTSVAGGGNGFDVQGMLNLPLVKDNLAIRANVYDRTDPGFIDDDGLGKSDINTSRIKGGRASLLWTPTDKTSLRVTAMAQNLNSDGSPTEALDPDTLQPLYGDLQQRSAAGSGNFDARYRLYNATFKTDFGWAKLMSSTSYSTLDKVSTLDATPLLYLGPQANGQPYSTLETDDAHQTKATEEVRLTSPTSQHVEWLVGVFLTHETGDHPQYIYAADYYSGTPLPSPLGIAIGKDSQPSTYDAWAVYGTVTWHLTDRFDVKTGLRYSHNRQHFTEIGSGLLFGSPTPITLLDKRSSDSTTTYSLTPAFHINDRTTLYARVASGFLPGGPNVVTVNLPGVPKTFSPTKLTDYELGLKTSSRDNRFLMDLSAYYIDWTKIPLVTFVSPFTFLSNGGQAKSTGLEATVALIPVSGLKLSANASWNDAQLTKDAPAPSNGKSGDPLPYAPKFTTNLSADYDFALGAGWHGYVGASYRYIDERRTDFTFTGLPSPTIPAYHTINLRIGANHDQWSIDAYVKNVTNERGIVLAGTAGQLNPVTGRMENNATIITPRLFGISVSRNF